MGLCRDPVITCWCTVFPKPSQSSVFVRSGSGIIGIVTTVHTRRRRNCVSIPASERDLGIHRRVHSAWCFLGNRSSPVIYGSGGLKMTTQFQLVLRIILNPLTWKIWWAPNNASRWQMGFNLTFKGLIMVGYVYSFPIIPSWRTYKYFLHYIYIYIYIYVM